MIYNTAYTFSYILMEFKELNLMMAAEKRAQ